MIDQLIRENLVSETMKALCKEFQSLGIVVVITQMDQDNPLRVYSAGADGFDELIPSMFALLADPESLATVQTLKNFDLRLKASERNKNYKDSLT
jgi:hypothetical protein